MTTPTGLVAIPPLARTVLYFVLALANAVATTLVASSVVSPLYSALVSSISAVFFSVAGSNVVAAPVAPVQTGPISGGY